MKYISIGQSKKIDKLCEDIQSRIQGSSATTFKYISPSNYLSTLLDVLTDHKNFPVGRSYLTEEDALIDSRSVGNDFDVVLNDLSASLKKKKYGGW